MLVPYMVGAKKQRVTIYYLNIGDPDVETPEVMMNVLNKWKDNPIRYGQSQGEPAFLESLQIYYRRLGYSFIDIPHIQVTSGGSEAISLAFFATCQPGDEVIVFEPLYANYNSYAVVNDVRLVPVRTRLEDGFHLPPQKEIEKYISQKTKAILYCNPNNPTGTVYTKTEVEMLVAITEKFKLFLMSDEVYREYVFDGKTQTSLLSYMQKIPKHAIVLDSMSKRYSLCGVRLGALVSMNEELMAGVLRIAQGRLSAGIVDQAIAARLTDVPQSYLENVNKEYEQRRDVLYRGLKQIPGVVIPKPEGAFYAIVGLPVDDAENFCKWLLTDFRDQNETIMLAPAAGFYATPGLGKNEVRIAYVLNIKKLSRCIEILTKALTEYKN